MIAPDQDENNTPAAAPASNEQANQKTQAPVSHDEAAAPTSTESTETPEAPADAETSAQ